MNRLQELESAQKDIRRLDYEDHKKSSPLMYKAYQKRNTFGLNTDTKIHRIFQKDFLDKDISDNHLTLPRASSSAWKDVLENPLSSVYDIDISTGKEIYLGSLTQSFYALCWTQREKATPSDWEAFSHGKEAIRVTTTVGKLMDRIMDISDPCYMHRSWLIEVDYKDPELIKQMKTPTEVYNRMESQGALLALSAAVVRTNYKDENEIRLLFDPSVHPQNKNIQLIENSKLIRMPFNWEGLIEHCKSCPNDCSKY